MNIFNQIQREEEAHICQCGSKTRNKGLCHFCLKYGQNWRNKEVSK